MTDPRVYLVGQLAHAHMLIEQRLPGEREVGELIAAAEGILDRMEARENFVFEVPRPMRSRLRSRRKPYRAFLSGSMG